MLSQKTKYALRAVLYLSVQAKSQKIKGGKEISDELKIPSAFTNKILQELAKKDIVSSVKGPRGGFFLSEKNLRLPLIQIINAMDDMAFFHSCGLGLSECSEEKPCPVHGTFKIARNNLFQLFSTKTIKELSEEIINKDFFLVR
ncbi:MAG: Rrf2 family transcriptional regulator [Flavobacteriales bacterium]|nr:Rrf2 family transcriptional regulator [Flavobacteriales bacterium]